jgi:hypothetical protein
VGVAVVLAAALAAVVVLKDEALRVVVLKTVALKVAAITETRVVQTHVSKAVQKNVLTTANLLTMTAKAALAEALPSVKILVIAKTSVIAKSLATAQVLQPSRLANLPLQSLMTASLAVHVKWASKQGAHLLTNLHARLANLLAGLMLRKSVHLSHEWHAN